MSRQIWDPKQKPLDSTLATKATELRLQEQQDIKALTSIYIYNINTGEHINFPLVPDSLTDNYKSTFHVESGIFGRTTPLYFYTGGSDKTLSFSFSVHEDVLDKTTLDKDIKYNLRKFLEKLLSFTEPHIATLGTDTDLFKEPQVYLQIGDQFAGKGFIEVSWSYNLPYRNKRYILADVNLTFTYNIEYEPVERKLFESGRMEIEEYISTDDLTLDLDKITGVNWKNFMPEYLSYDFFRTYSYEESRGLEINKLSASTISQIFSAIDSFDRSKYLGKSSILEVHLYNWTADDLRDSHLKQIFFRMLHELYRNINIALHPSLSTQYKVDSLEAILKKAKQLNEVFTNTEGSVVVTAEGIEGLITAKMSKEEKIDFKRDIKRLIEVLNIQLNILRATLTGGASS